MKVWDEIARGAATESALWAESLLPAGDRELVAVFSPLLVQPKHAVGLETIYEGYLLHYGRPRLFGPADGHTGLLLGDYLYAHGLVRIAEHGEVQAVADLAELISLCAHLRADGAPGDGEAWAATAAFLGRGPLRAGTDAREGADPDAVERALALHRGRVG